MSLLDYHLHLLSQYIPFLLLYILTFLPKDTHKLLPPLLFHSLLQCRLYLLLYTTLLDTSTDQLPCHQYPAVSNRFSLFLYMNCRDIDISLLQFRPRYRSFLPLSIPISLVLDIYTLPHYLYHYTKVHKFSLLVGIPGRYTPQFPVHLR